MSICKIIHHGKQHEFNDLETAQAFLDQLPSPRGDLEVVGGPLLFRLMNEIGAPMHNWKEINQAICSEWDALFHNAHNESDLLKGAEKRDSLLQTFKIVMDIAETVIQPVDLDRVRAARDRQYKTFIFQESMVGESICVETLYTVTLREIDAGRMLHYHSCRKIAVDAIAASHLTRNELLINRNEKEQPLLIQNNTLGKKIRSWFSKN